MWSKLIGSIDFGKLTLDATSGLIAGLAVLLAIDAFSSARIVEGFVNDKTGGGIAAAVIMALVASYLLGVLMDTLYHTLGRFLSRLIWIPLKEEFEYRADLMQEMGLSREEFEWVQSKDTSNKIDAIESKYMRYTEVAGSAAFSTVLLAISIGLFLWKEYNNPAWGMAVSILVYILAVGLFIASAAALAKYEKNKTASAMDEIRGMCPHNDVTPYPKTSPRHFDHKGWLLFLPLLLTAFYAVPLVSAHNQTANFVPVISVLNSDSSVPHLEIDVIVPDSSEKQTMTESSKKETVTISPEKQTVTESSIQTSPESSNNAVPESTKKETITDSSNKVTLTESSEQQTITELSNEQKEQILISRSMLINLTTPKNIHLIDNKSWIQSELSLVGQPVPYDPPWNLKVKLSKTVADNLTVQLNTEYSSNGTVHPGDWSLPVYVSDDSQNNYLLAYIIVKISLETAPASGNAK